MNITEHQIRAAFQLQVPIPRCPVAEAALDLIEAEVGKRMLAQSRKAHTIPVTPNAGNIFRAQRAAELREKLRPEVEQRLARGERISSISVAMKLSWNMVARIAREEVGPMAATVEKARAKRDEYAPEVLRRHEAGFSNRAIARVMPISETTVARIVKEAAE